ncbi:24797_t:CDS:1, partial [Entrophospora sp. SA101]
ILIGLAAFGFAKTIPGKCQNICDPNISINNSTNSNVITPNSSNNLNLAPSANNDESNFSFSDNALTDSATNTANDAIDDGKDKCNTICKKGVFDALYYGGIGFIALGGFMLAIQVFCMLCRIGSSG